MKTIRVIAGILIWLLSSGLAVGQSLYTNQLYNQNLFSLNAAYAGTDSATVLAVQGRSGWNGISNAPTGGLLTVHSPLGDNIGVGGRVLTDQRGAFSTFMAELAVSYRVQLSEEMRLQLGMNAGTMRSQIREGNYTANGYVDLRDPLLALYDESNLMIGFAGALIWRGLNFGVAIPNLLDQENQLFNKPLLAHASVDLKAGTQWQLRPSVAVQRMSNHPVLTDVSMMGMWNGRFWLQAGYRSNESLLISGGVRLKNRIGIGYGYESPSGPMATATSGSHEILISLGLGGSKPVAAVNAPAGQ